MCQDLPDRARIGDECDQPDVAAAGGARKSSDLDAKYAFLNQFEAAGVRGGANAVDRARGREIFDAVRRMSGRAIGGGAVLDYGGGDGRLMEPFRSVGCHCELVDYSPRPVPGVVKKGDTLRDLADDQRYDWIVASHVIEHVADPLGELRALRGHLLPDGILFVEVPFEIWGRPPLPEEPGDAHQLFHPFFAAVRACGGRTGSPAVSAGCRAPSDEHTLCL